MIHRRLFFVLKLCLWFNDDSEFVILSNYQPIINKKSRIDKIL